jgi:hypothetical protein
MRTRYNKQEQNIKTLTMKDCLQHNRLTVNPSFDFGFENVQVQKYRQVE